MAATKVSMKLLINTQINKVLFAEAGKECVDFLFHILSLPIATVIRLLKEQGMVGCLANLYGSIESLNETYIQPDKNKDSLLKPSAPSVPLFLLEGGSQPTKKAMYQCSSGRGYSAHYYYSDYPNATCSACHGLMSNLMTYVAPPPGVVTTQSSEDGFVKGVVTYMIMDDLVVKPMSTISSLTLLNEFKVKDIGTLKEKEVKITMKEVH